MKNVFAIALATTLATSLAGCGGGGGWSPSSLAAAAPQAQAPAQVATNADLVTNVTPPTYAAGSVERGAWDVLMRERRA